MPANCINANAIFCLSGLPANGFCWIVTIDLAGGYEFCLTAEGGVRYHLHRAAPPVAR